MRKLLTVFLIFSLAAGLCACGGSQDPDTPDFEANSIQWTSVSAAMSQNSVQTLQTVCEKDASVLTTGSVNVYSEACEAPEGFKTPDGYAWQRLRMRVTFADENANENGYRYCYLMTDYYDMNRLKKTLSYDEDKQCDTFTVVYNDKKYKKCVAVIGKTVEDWVMNEETGLQSCSEILTWTLCLPEGYDGICCSVYNASLEGQTSTVSSFLECYDPASFAMYRLGAVK